MVLSKNKKPRKKVILFLISHTQVHIRVYTYYIYWTIVMLWFNDGNDGDQIFS